ncbi:MAG: helix-turn-helix transcriptional regulator [Actinomycetes bacterium]|jgi:transcriptional regulator with XRE-family HTH domain|nr:helix-turn-helix transcriptional regulator [Actinomycetes bacterium]
MRLLLLEARKAAGMTRREVAAKVGITEASLANAEFGRTNPSTKTFYLLSRLYGVTMDSLILPDEGDEL